VIDGNEFGDFLRTRRAKVSPADVGLRGGSRRRVSGLRREELAQLAGISVEYYQRLEQGRATRPSDEVLDAIADILSLSEVEQAHLHRLAAPRRPHRDARATPDPVPAIRPELARLLALMDKVPALAIDDLFNVLAMNEPARALFPDVAALPEDRRNLARFLFQTPAGRDFYVEWDEVAAVTVAQLRWTAGRFPHDAAVEAFIAELSNDPEFRRLWDCGDVEVRTHGAKTIRHPSRGVLRMDYENFELPGGQRQRVVAFSTEAGSPS
jgi:transcriptional regulator with XRE-family HTH domain